MYTRRGQGGIKKGGVEAQMFRTTKGEHVEETTEGVGGFVDIVG